jgi:hypothetical protein
MGDTKERTFIFVSLVLQIKASPFRLNPFLWVSYLTTLSVSDCIASDDGMINEYGAVSGLALYQCFPFPSKPKSVCSLLKTFASHPTIRC